MEPAFLKMDKIKALYPEQWVLLGNPQIENATVLGGIVLYHSMDKKEVCYKGRNLVADYPSVTIAFSGETFPSRKIGILRRV